MKKTAVQLTIVAFLVAGLAGYKYSKRSTPTANTAQIETTLRGLSEKIETAKVQESNDDQQLQRAIDIEVNKRGVNPHVAEELKEDLKSRVAETSSEPTLTEAADKSNVLKSQVEELKNENATAKSTKDWSAYIPKLLFSILLCLASLYIILKGGYSESTEKWSFAMINIIVGVWIGTVTS
jgi:hypothetical protein